MPGTTPREVPGRVFGYDAFRGRQEAIIEHVAGGGDCLVLMPTGGGKSLCYQIPALLRDGLAVVVSPRPPLPHLYHPVTQYHVTSDSYDVQNRRVALQLRTQGPFR